MIKIPDEKLELVRLLIEEKDVSVLKKIKMILSPKNSAGWEMSDELYTELQERTKLRKEGKMETYSWEEVEARILSRKRTPDI